MASSSSSLPCVNSKLFVISRISLDILSRRSLVFCNFPDQFPSWWVFPRSIPPWLIPPGVLGLGFGLGIHQGELTGGNWPGELTRRDFDRGDGWGNSPVEILREPLLSSLCTEVVGVFCIADLDLNDIFRVEFDLFVNCLEWTMVIWYGKKLF